MKFNNFTYNFESDSFKLNNAKIECRKLSVTTRVISYKGDKYGYIDINEFYYSISQRHKDHVISCLKYIDESITKFLNFGPERIDETLEFLSSSTNFFDHRMYDPYGDF